MTTASRAARAARRAAHPATAMRLVLAMRPVLVAWPVLVARPVLVACLALAAAAGPSTASAQRAGAGALEVDALECWRRIAKHAVHVGERFDMVLTCAVVETDAARAAPDAAGLDPATLAVSPFEVLDGERYGDIVRGSRRFFQYRYVLRIIGEDHFGLDVELPPLEVTYRIARSLDGLAAVEGRELVYVLPPESVRVLSLVPAAAGDIRELPGETFGDAEARLFRANATGLAAAAFGVAALGALVAAVVRARRDRRGTESAGAERLAGWRVAGAALGELRAVEAASRAGGWTAELVARALAAFRVAAALAVDLPVAQLAAADRTRDVDRDGRLRVRRWSGSTRGHVSSPVTASRMHRELKRVRAERPDGADTATSIGEALAFFTAARYGTPADLQPEALSAHLDAAVGAVRALQVAVLPPMRAVRRLRAAWRDGVARIWPR